jgi:hypothetical protein
MFALDMMDFDIGRRRRQRTYRKSLLRPEQGPKCKNFGSRIQRSVITIQFRRKFSKYRVLFVNNRIVINNLKPNKGVYICKVRSQIENIDGL